MEPADNGVIISYEIKTQPVNAKSTYDNCSYKDHKEVFDVDGEKEEEGVDAAFTRFKELWMKSYKEMKS